MNPSSSSSSSSSFVHPLSSILPRSKQREHQCGDEVKNERGSCLLQQQKEDMKLIY
jgi:hypothetical protein